MNKEKENRKASILEILKEKKVTTAKDLSKMLNVSEMTIYRDIRELSNEGFIDKKHGSIKIQEKENKQKIEDQNQNKQCPICFKNINPQTSYKILLDTSEIVEACCEHCGLILHQKYEQKNVAAICYDFIKRQPINSYEANFVVDSLAVPCCSPSVIAFNNKEDAERFTKGFGGKVLNFVDAYNELKNRSSKNLHSCCHPVRH
ncbi:MAG: DeoR family transcriptional regulator [Leptospiraceae bacterium]|nr:DeoR family transcriptional regulator [Leptospiraceae bacterium]MDW7976076.1 DeoR family transcriptional regulator [Leptospiraceae bacterium]